MEHIPASVPADIGDWCVARVFRESARLMWKHLGDMCLIILIFTFPASLIKVWHLQFHWNADQVNWNLVLHFVLDLASQLLFVFGFGMTIDVLIERIFPDGECSQSFFTTLKSFFRRFWKNVCKRAPTDSESGLRNEDPNYYNGNFFKGLGAILLCVFIYIVISTSGVNFTPEAVAEMGLPPWTVFVFTVLVAAIVGISTSYLHLTGVLVFVWMRVPQTPTLDMKFVS